MEVAEAVTEPEWTGRIQDTADMPEIFSHPYAMAIP